MPRRTFRSSFRGASQRRGMEWFGASTATSIAIAANTVSTQWIILPSTARLYTNPTVVRTRGQARLTTTSQAFPRVGAMGIIAWDWPNDLVPVAPNQPDPWANPELDWMWHHYFFNGSIVLSTSVLDLTKEGSIDSKAMRKLGANQGVLFCCRNATTASDATELQWGVRCLIKE